MENQKLEQQQNSPKIKKSFIKHPLVVVNIATVLFSICSVIIFYIFDTGLIEVYFLRIISSLTLLMFIEAILLLLYSIILFFRKDRLKSKKFFWTGVILVITVFCIESMSQNIGSLILILVIGIAFKELLRIWKMEKKDLKQDSQDINNKNKEIIPKKKGIPFGLALFLSNIIAIALLFGFFYVVSQFSNSSEKIDSSIVGEQNIQDKSINQDFNPGLGREDPRDMIQMVVNLVLTFLALEAVLLIIFSIYIFIKNKIKKIKSNKASKYFAAGVIMLIIVMMAWGIVMFQIDKPVIYLYPTEKTDIKVQLDFQGKLIADYPDYDYSINGWEVTAYPDGKIINHADNQEYSYLFWEGIPNKKIDYDLSTGFVVRGEDTKKFLQEKLAEIGLTPKEYNEFIVYWYPKMINNKYNLIHFAGKEYTDTAELNITPTPNSVLRVFMVFKSLNKEINIQPQTFPKFERNGFTVVEWGGSEL